MSASSRPSFARACIKAALGAAFGWGLAALVYFSAAPDEANPLAQYEASKSYVVTMQRMGGSAQMIWNEVVDAIASCFHGQNLGITIFAVTTAVVFLYLFRAIARAEEAKPSDPKSS